MKISNCLPVFKSQTVHARYNFLKLHLVFTVTQLILQSCYKLLLNLLHSFALSFYMSGCFSIVTSLLSKFIRHFLWFLRQQSADSGKREKEKARAAVPVSSHPIPPMIITPSSLHRGHFQVCFFSKT